jgi:hypothetical protein
MAEGLIGTGITPTSKSQIDLREKLLANKGDTRWQQLYTSKTGWVQLSSSVNIDGSSEKAKSNVLASNKINGDGINAGYRKGPLGNRPVPGITGMNVTAINRFGTLRKSTVTFKAYDVEQLSDMEQLYLRPGYSVLLEWGHTVYKTNQEEVVTSPITLSDNLNYFDTQVTTKVESEIVKLKQSSSGNYDAVFGYISNFQWSYNIDGSYDCRVDIISKGELLESIEYAIYSTKELDTEEDTYKTISPLHKVFLTAKQNIDYTTGELNAANLSSDLGGGTNTVALHPAAGILDGQLKAFATTETRTPTVLKEGEALPSLLYIRMGAFIELLNEYVLLKNGKTKDSKPITPFRANSEATYVTYPNHHSGDPGAVMIGNGRSEHQFYYGTEFVDLLKVSDSDRIVNLWVNVDMILNELTNGLLADGTSKILPVLERILVKIETALGNINEFDIAYDEDVNEHVVIDRRNIGTGKDLPSIRVSGKTTTVSNLSITSKLGPNLAKMISIAAQASTNVANVGVEVENLFKWNTGLSDRIITERIVPSEAKGTFTPTEDTDLYTSADSEFRYNSILLAQNKIYDASLYSSMKSTHRLITQHEFKKDISTGKKDKLAKPGIIPFEVSMTLDGIGGLKIGQTFQIDDPIFPTKYKDRIAFILTGIEHTIQNNRWTTSIKAQTINKPV